MVKNHWKGRARIDFNFCCQGRGGNNFGFSRGFLVLLANLKRLEDDIRQTNLTGSVVESIEV